MNQRISPDQNLQSLNERTKTLKTNELSQGPRGPKFTTLLRPALKINKQTLARMIMKASAFNFFLKHPFRFLFRLPFSHLGASSSAGKDSLNAVKNCKDQGADCFEEKMLELFDWSTWCCRFAVPKTDHKTNGHLTLAHRKIRI
jgi:hypothetical protein